MVDDRACWLARFGDVPAADEAAARQVCHRRASKASTIAWCESAAARRSMEGRASAMRARASRSSDSQTRNRIAVAGSLHDEPVQISDYGRRRRRRRGHARRPAGHSLRVCRAAVVFEFGSRRFGGQFFEDGTDLVGLAHLLGVHAAHTGSAIGLRFHQAQAPPVHGAPRGRTPGWRPIRERSGVRADGRRAYRCRPGCAPAARA